MTVSEARIGDYGWIDRYNKRADITAWTFRGRVFEADPDLMRDDVRALVLEGENKTRLRLERARALQSMTEQLDDRSKRQPIPQDVKMFVRQRDKGRCMQCRSQRDLEFDHIIPIRMGGSNTERNLQLLCADCIRRKGATLG